jgi:hypothetical protein
MDLNKHGFSMIDCRCVIPPWFAAGTSFACQYLLRSSQRAPMLQWSIRT